MKPELLISIAAFGAITTGVWAVLSMFSGGKSRASERLEEMRDPLRRRGMAGGGPEATGMKGMIEKTAPTLSKALQSKDEGEQSVLKIRLGNAGFSNPNAPRNFLALKIISLILGLLFGAIYGFANMGVSNNSWMGFVIGGGLGFYLPEAILALLKMSRQQKIFLQLPDSLDLLVVCVEAGLACPSSQYHGYESQFGLRVTAGVGQFSASGAHAEEAENCRANSTGVWSPSELCGRR